MKNKQCPGNKCRQHCLQIYTPMARVLNHQEEAPLNVSPKPGVDFTWVVFESHPTLKIEGLWAHWIEGKDKRGASAMAPRVSPFVRRWLVGAGCCALGTCIGCELLLSSCLPFWSCGFCGGSCVPAGGCSCPTPPPFRATPSLHSMASAWDREIDTFSHLRNGVELEESYFKIS